MKLHEPKMTVTFPETIAVLPNLNLNERTALTLISQRPRCSNSFLAEQLNMSVRGVEALLRRLRTNGLLQIVGKGRARKLKLLFSVEHHTQRGECNQAETHIQCGNSHSISPARRSQREITPLFQAVEQAFCLIDNLLKRRRIFYETPMRLLEPLMVRAQRELPPGTERQVLLDMLTTRHDAFAAMEFARGLSHQQQRKIDKWLSHASPSELSALRAKITSARALGYSARQMLTDCMSTRATNPASATLVEV